jgi:hypothetical protein
MYTLFNKLPQQTRKDICTFLELHEDISVFDSENYQTNDPKHAVILEFFNSANTLHFGFTSSKKLELQGRKDCTPAVRVRLPVSCSQESLVQT